MDETRIARVKAEADEYDRLARQTNNSTERSRLSGKASGLRLALIMFGVSGSD